MHNNPVRRHRHKHSRGLSVGMMIRMLVILIAICITWGITILHCMPNREMTTGIITAMNATTDEVTVDYDVNNKHYSEKFESTEFHYEGEEVTVTYNKSVPSVMYIEDEEENVFTVFEVFLVISIILTIMLIIDILHIISFLIKFGIIRIFFRQ